MKKVISVCGSDGGDQTLSEKAINVAEKIGELVAKKDAVLACGGHSGIMEAACKGAKKENGITLAVTPFDKQEANRYVDIVIPTKIGNIRNFLVVNSGDAVIAVGGRWGTLNEISYAMISDKPIILVKGTGGCVDEIINGCIMQDIESHYLIAENAEDAVEKAFKLI